MLLLFLIAAVVLAAPSETAAPRVVGAAITPTPTPLPTDVRRAATLSGYGELADRIAQAARPTMVLNPRGRPRGVGTSRIGGDPDLANGTRWPRCHGRPQSFLAQIRVSDLPPGASELRRHGGVLLFFTHVEFEPGETEYGLWAGDCSTVIHAREGERLRRTRAPRGVMALKPAALRFSQRPDVPDTGLDVDHLMPPLQDITPPSWEAWFEFRYGLQGRPTLEHRLLGYGSSPNGGNDCYERAERSTLTWRHLLTIGPDDDRGFSVADAGRLQLFISPADLRAGRFDRVCGVFDSG